MGKHEAILVLLVGGAILQLGLILVSKFLAANLLIVAGSIWIWASVVYVVYFILRSYFNASHTTN